MAQKEYIKYLYEEEEKSLLEITRQTGLNYRTVRKYTRQEDWRLEEKTGTEAKSYPVLGGYIPVIDKWLEEDRLVPRKQRHTIMRVYRRLQEECGFAGGYATVRDYVHKKKAEMKLSAEGYLPLSQPKGYAQGDFGKFRYEDGEGREQDGYFLVLSFPNSNKGYPQAFPAQNQECLLTGMQRIFEHIGGVPIRIRFDNMSTAVAQVLEGRERVLTEGFSRFKLHYRFQADFCNPAAGNEKGNVENKVGYTRRNLFVPIPTITSFDEFNRQLLERSEEDARRPHYRHKVSIQELWEEERKELLALPEYPYEVFRYESLRVNKYGFATIETNKYGLSPSLNGETVQAKIYFDHVEFYYDHHLVGRYRRCCGSRQELMDWSAYIGTLCRKPGAVEDTRFFQDMPQRWQTYLARAQGRDRKSALQLLQEMAEDGNTALCDDALVLAEENGRTDVDSVRQCYYMISKKEHRPEPLRLADSGPTLNYNPDLSAYDRLMGGETDG